MASNPRASIFIPTYNGEEYLDQILYAIFKQKTDFDYEVLIIDSGSKDKTLDIVRKYLAKHDNIRLHEIPNTEFGHGKTRNLAAQMCTGEFMVYLSHDAIPAHDRWLYEMLKPFEMNEKVVAVMGKQDPRQKCFPLMKYDIQNVFKGFGPDMGLTFYYNDYFVSPGGVLDFVSFYSDVNSATRRDFLLNVIPYKDVKYSEDQMFGKDVIEAGYLKVYASRGNVQHSNDMKLGEYKKRMFDETLGLRKIGHDFEPLSRKAMLKNIVKGALKDTVRILIDGQYTKKRKLYWLVINPLFHIEKWRGVYVGTHVQLDDDAAANKHSLEKSRTK